MEYSADQIRCAYAANGYNQRATARKFISNGSLVGFDEYALGCGFGFDIPQQAFWLTHPDHGITFSMPVHAERPSKPESREWLTFEKAA